MEEISKIIHKGTTAREVEKHVDAFLRARKASPKHQEVFPPDVAELLYLYGNAKKKLPRLVKRGLSELSEGYFRDRLTTQADRGAILARIATKIAGKKRVITVADLGAGVGLHSHQICSVLPQRVKLTVWETKQRYLSAIRDVLKDLANGVVRGVARRIKRSKTKVISKELKEKPDLVICSYLFGRFLDHKTATRLIETIACNRLQAGGRMVIISPELALEKNMFDDKQTAEDLKRHGETPQTVKKYEKIVERVLDKTFLEKCGLEVEADETRERLAPMLLKNERWIVLRKKAEAWKNKVRKIT